MFSERMDTPYTKRMTYDEV